MNHTNEYRVVLSALSEEDGGGYLAEVPELPGCIADGETRREALLSISDAIDSWIDTAKAEGRPIPLPEVYIEQQAI